MQLGKELVFVEGFATTIGFDDHQRRIFDGFVGCKPPTAIQTFPASSDGRCLLAGSGVYDLVLHCSTVGTSHACSPVSSRRSGIWIDIGSSSCKDPILWGNVIIIQNIELSRENMWFAINSTPDSQLAFRPPTALRRTSVSRRRHGEIPIPEDQPRA